MNVKNYKNLCPTVFDFCKIKKMREKILLNPRTFLFVIVLYYTKRRCSQIEPQLKVKIEDGL